MSVSLSERLSKLMFVLSRTHACLFRRQRPCILPVACIYRRHGQQMKCVRQVCSCIKGLGMGVQVSVETLRWAHCSICAHETRSQAAG